MDTDTALARDLARTLEDHGIVYIWSVDDRLWARDVAIDIEGIVHEQWVEMTGWSMVQLYHWLRY